MRDTDGHSIAYTVSTDESFVDPQGALFPLLDDQLTVGNDLGQALDPSWQALPLTGEPTSVMPPFANLDCQE